MTQHSADDHELLTPAASEVLSEFTEDFRRSLLRRAAVAARRSGSNEITVSDVARAYESEQRSADSYSQRRSRFVALLGVYAALGVAIAAGSGVVLLIRATDSASSTDRLAAIGAVVGVFVASLSAVGTISIRRLRLGGLELSSYPLRDVEGDFIRAWASFEIDAKASLGEVVGESAVARMPLSELFERLRGAGLISEADVATLRRVLKTRNGVVHGADVTPHDVNESLHSLVRVADKLRIG